MNLFNLYGTALMIQFCAKVSISLLFPQIVLPGDNITFPCIFRNLIFAPTMNEAETITDRMARIRAVFEEVQMVAGSQPDDALLIDYLNHCDAQFRSVAFESASMSRALTDIALSAFPERWAAFAQRSQVHAVHVYIGLGWALAQRQVSLSDYLHDIGPIMQARVLDGYGYYDGMFRSRSSVRDRVVPDEISGYDLRAYDQGLGRSLWYAAKGNTAQLLKSLDGFAAARKGDLWRGVGIAVSYVGGCDEKMLKSLMESASVYKLQLASGAALLARARIHAGTLDTDSQAACHILCRSSAEEASAILDRTEPLDETSPDAYLKWLAALESALNKSVKQ